MRIPENRTAARSRSACRVSWKDVCHLLSYIEKDIRSLPGRAFRLPDFHWAQSEFMAKRNIGRLVVAPFSLWAKIGAAYASV